ncbi:spore germination protein (amino acid permease) [Clostridium tetanomorphum]|nr:spore germination protein [Clostridium tetanomorphum DSM 665]NRS85221.1 spore germination protein (amino acid permease) [Clostridium tetanomorphum]SQC03070.1 spore germination protein [Clostridium tetanomorphum]
MVFIATYISKKHPKDDILILNKKIYGKFFGSLFNIIFLIFFLSIATQVAAGMTNTLKIYMVTFLNKWNMLTVVYLITAYAAYGGIKVIGRINEVVFLSTFIVYLIPLFSISKGDISNLTPVLGSGVNNIIKAVKGTATAYSGIEILFIVYPFLDSYINIKKSGIKSIIFACSVYTLFTISTILYMGIDTSTKFLWPVVTVTDSLRIPIINSFRYIFLSMWTMTMFKVISIDYYIFAYGLNKTFNKIDTKYWIIMLYPVMVMLSGVYGIPTMRRDFLGKIFPLYVLYNIIFISITAILIALGKGDNNE